MTTLLRTTVTWVWLLLMGATAASFWVAVDHGVTVRETATALVVTVAVAKVYLVGMYFMELRHAPLLLKGAFNAWCAGCWAAILGVYFMG